MNNFRKSLGTTVNSYSVLLTFGILLAIFGSALLAMRFPENPVVRFFFGGYQIFLSWVAFIYVFYRIESVLIKSPKK